MKFNQGAMVVDWNPSLTFIQPLVLDESDNTESAMGTPLMKLEDLWTGRPLARKKPHPTMLLLFSVYLK